MTKFKYIGDSFSAVGQEQITMLEIAHQLKRIADSLSNKEM